MNNPFQPLIKSFMDALSKYSVKQEDVVGVDITPNAIRLAQLAESKDGWVLEKLVSKTVREKGSLTDVVENQDEYVQKLRELILGANLKTTNAAISIPITSAIICTATMPLMNDEEIKNAIEYDSLWNNILQLAEKLDEYSIFWQVIRRNPSANTMELLFVASKLSEINHYVQIVTKAGLNPVVVDVRCFAIRNALKTHTLNKSGTTALIEFGPNESYALIVTDDAPFIYDIYISEADRALIENGIPSGEVGDRLYDRFAGQVMQAFRAYDTKFGNSIIDKVLLVSPIQDKTELLSQMRKSLDGFHVELFNPMADLLVPSNLDDVIQSEVNTSVFTSAIGLALRKVDIFGYYKYVTGVNNVNLLPNRDLVKNEERKKVVSKLGMMTALALVGLFIVATLLYQYFFNNSLSKDFQNAQQIEKQVQVREANIANLKSKKSAYSKMLEASKEFKSNQESTYALLSAVNQVVPGGVWFTVINFESPSTLIIKGDAANDQVIVTFVDRLQKIPMIEKASLQNMTLTPADSTRKGSGIKQFEVRCVVKLGLSSAAPSDPLKPILVPSGIFNYQKRLNLGS